MCNFFSSVDRSVDNQISTCVNKQIFFPYEEEEKKENINQVSYLSGKFMTPADAVK
jgi:hypothetical protein